MANTGLIRPNPALERSFSDRDVARSMVGGETMTINGTVGVTALLLFITVATAFLSWGRVPVAFALVGIFVAMGLQMLVAFKPMTAPKVGVPFAIVEGLVVGVISSYYAEAFEGIVPMAAGLTIAILAAMLFIYRARIIKVTQNFRIAVGAAVGGVALFYLATIALSFVGFQMPLVNSNSGFGIAFTLFVIGLAAATLAVNFDFIETGAEQGLPKQMEWVGAIGLLATLVWLYIELLRLLSKLQSRD